MASDIKLLLVERRMDIYIKSFNRPYLLHRTIASVYHYLNDFNGRIVVLDDGTPKKYLDKINKLFPEVIIKKSNFYNKKSKNIDFGVAPEKVIPANFWRDEVLMGSEYFVLLEDDMWFTKFIDYKVFSSDVEASGVDMIKLMWLKNKNLIADNIKKQTVYFNVTQPKVLTVSPFLFDAVFRTNNWKLRSVVERFFDYEAELLKYYHMFIVAGAVFSKKYYQTCWKSSQKNVDEIKQIAQLLKSKKSFVVGNSKEEILKTTLKTTATLISKEHLRDTVDIFEVNKRLNEAWFNGNTYAVDDFANDIPTEWISEALSDCQQIQCQLFDEWERWFEAFSLSYKRIGCDVT